MYNYLFIVLGINSIIIAGLSMIAGRMFLPWWGWELIFSFYWLTATFKSLNRTYLDPTEDRTELWELKPMIAWVFSIHWGMAYLLSFAILAPLGVPWYIRMPIAYFGNYVLVIAIPMQLAVIFYPQFKRKMESERIDPTMIRDLALQCEMAQEFMRRLSPVKIYVCDNAFKNQVSSCVFVHRQPRNERLGLMEDAVLCIPVDMSVRQALCGKIKTERYIFRVEADHSSVYHLPTENLIERHLQSEPLDDDTLQKFDFLFDRFPSLQDAPFTLAVRNTPFVLVG